ncbi:putative ATP-binding cassette transporter [Lysobacter sp. yr284]|uniref:cyclic peptide export ABC transporter n=1 Tax=Lysobacter sp. yr284 TaxID=1761791 RepID=UPI000897D8C4|nr:cyclic peptide export ABC transporter [Lysobacter sp. yr284]SDZ17852.1 putative ATP-binding cassette transporter [Lysobacter sp. yr284]
MILDVIKKSRLRIAVISAISAVAGATNIWLLILINRQAQANSAHLGDAAVFGGALILMICVSLLSQTLLSRLSAKTFFRLREELVRGISNLSVREIDALGTHRLYTALTRDVPSVHELIIVLPTYVFNFTVATACLVYLCTVSPRLFGIFLFFLLVALLVAKFVINDRAERKFVERRRTEDELFKRYKSVVEGNKELKLHEERADAFLNKDIQSHAVDYRNATVEAEFFWNMSSNWSLAMIFIGVGVLLFAAGHIGVTDRSVISSFVLVIFYMISPLTLLMNSFRTIHSAKIGLSRLGELKLPVGAASAHAPPAASEGFSSLAFERAVFAYEIADQEGGFTVGPLDLHIGKGEIVYFVGGNGSGKTTAAKVLMGFYPLRSGAVCVNGKPVADPRAVFQRFSAVFQDYHLFESIFPKRGGGVDDEAIAAMIDRLRLSDKVGVSGGVLSTTKLSYGQRKRLALLVAYFDDSDVYVFDEWAADQDPEFREFFYKSFLPDMKRAGKTMVVISHDDRYFHLADKVVKFEGGRIVSVEGGTGRVVESLLMQTVET